MRFEIHVTQQVNTKHLCIRCQPRGPTSAPAAVGGEESWEDELMSVDGMDAYYYKLNLDPSSIQLVDTKEKYHECISRLSRVPFWMEL